MTITLRVNGGQLVMSTNRVFLHFVKESSMNDKLEGKCHRLAFAAGLFHGETGVDSVKDTRFTFRP